jgi:predicted Zn-dependent protease
MKRSLALAALVAGCSTLPDIPPPPGAPVEDRVSRPAPPASENVAVLGLVQNARADTSAGRLANAGATLERALRIEPRNPRLWQELARVRLKQEEFAQAESLAVRSNAWAGSDAALRAENWRLIAEAREARGDSQGARTALETAARMGQ